MSDVSKNLNTNDYQINSDSSLLYFLDLFGKRQKIKIAGKDKQTTLFGSILGSLSIIAIIILSYYFLSDLIFRTDVKIMYNQNRDMIPNNNFSDTPIVFSLMDWDGSAIDKRMYDINVMWISYELKQADDGTFKVDVKHEDIPYTKCDFNTSFGDNKNLFRNTPNMDELFCISPNLHNFTIHGKYSDIFNGFSYLNFYVNKCKNKTESTGGKLCPSSDEIDYKLSNVFFVFLSLDSEIDHYNSTKVNRKVLKSNNLLMSSRLNKRYFYYIKQVIYNTDYGFVFQDNYQETFYQQDNYDIEDLLPDDISPYYSHLGTFTLINENRIDIYYRSYEKLQNIIANIGGVVKGILLVASIINKIFTRNYSSLKLINSIFDFDDLEKEMIKSIPFKRNLFHGENQIPSLHTSKDHLSLNINFNKNNFAAAKSRN